MNADALIDALLSRWQRAYAEGRDLDAAELAADHPDLVPELGRRLDILRAADIADTATIPPPASLASETPTIPPPASPSETATIPPQATASATVKSGEDLSPPGYEVLGELGRGGMGVVYKARQTKLQRVVALKMILSGGHAGPDDLARFRTEYEAIARLQHPNIVQVHEVGEHEGRPFFSLEFCAGGSLEKKLSGTPLPPKEAARLVEVLARAMQAAHEKGVIHRDLKPANVLLTEDGTPRITDFGLAKKLDTQGQTATGAVMGTPSYMAPEQAGGKKEVGPAADIYALGAILYECLTTRPPFKAATAFDTILQVVSEEPGPLSQLNRQVPCDLETICLKCLQKEPTKRYASAAALAEDLRRFQTGEPIVARPVGVAERAAKWVRRNAVVSGLTAVIVLVLSVGLGASLWQMDRANSEATRADAQAKEAQDHLKTAQEEKQRADAKTREAEDEKKRADAKAQEARDQLKRAETLVYAGKLALAQSAFREGEGTLAVQYLGECQWDLRDWEHRHLWTRFNAPHTLRGHADRVYGVSFSSDGKRIASASGSPFKKNQPGEVRVWDAENGQELLSLKGHSGPVYSVCFSPDGRRVASGSGDGTVRLWDAQTGRQLRLFKVPFGEVMSVSFSPDSNCIAGAGFQAVRVWDASTGQLYRTLRVRWGWMVTSVAFGPDGHRIAATSIPLNDQTTAGEAVIWDLVTGREVSTLKGHRGWVLSICFAPDGKRLVTAGGGYDAKGDPGAGEIKIWDVETGKELRSLQGHASQVLAINFSPDGLRLASASGGPFYNLLGKPLSTDLRVWNVVSGEQMLSVTGMMGEIRNVVFSPDGNRLACAVQDGTVRLWDARTGQDVVAIRKHTDQVLGVGFSPDGRRLASASRDRSIRLWDVMSGQEILSLRGHNGPVYDVCFSPDGTILASTSGDKTVRVWDARTGQEALTLNGHTSEATSVCFSPDGRRLASASYDQTVRVWDARTGQEALTLKGHTGPVMGVSFSPDGRRLASAGDKTVRVWDALSGKQIRTLEGHPGTAFCVSFSPDGKWVAGTHSNRIRIWDVASGQELRSLGGHTHNVHRVSFSPNGNRLVSASFDQTVRLWDTKSGLEVLSLREHEGAVSSACFSLDGKYLASASWDKTVRVWDARAGQEALPLQGQPSTVAGVGYSHDGQRIVIRENSGIVRSWNALTGHEVLTSIDPGPPTRNQAISPNGQSLVQIDSDGVVVIEPRKREFDGILLRGMSDFLLNQRYRFEQAREAQLANDTFALAYHLRYLVQGSFTLTGARPRDAFPLWARRPPLTRAGGPPLPDTLALTPEELVRLDAQLLPATLGRHPPALTTAALAPTLGLSLAPAPARVSALFTGELALRQAEASSPWQAWASRGWVRHLRGDADGALADYRQAIARNADEPMLWANLGTVALHHGRLKEAEEARAKLAAWPGLHVAAWHVAEAQRCDEEGARERAAWHRKHLAK